MTIARRMLHGKYIDAITLLFVLFLGLGLAFGVYSGHRSNSIDIGAFGDFPYLANFNADEADLGYRYRWTKDHSDITFIGAGSAAPKQVTIRAQSLPRSIYPGPVTATLSLNGILLQPQVVTVTEKLQNYTFSVGTGGTAGASIQAPFSLQVAATAFRPPGDARSLGIKVDAVTLAQSTEGPNTPPRDLTLWWLLFICGVTLLLSPVRPWLRLVLGIVLSVVAAVIFFNNVFFAGAYLPPVAALTALAGSVVWQRRRIPRWPFAAGFMADFTAATPRLAMWAMLGIMSIFACIALWAITQVVWIGHADYAENANIARNLVEGHGLTVDYVSQFYKSYPGISHPAETWPLLQPVMIAPFFALFGPVTWAAKLPNLFILLALVWAVFRLAGRIWDGRVGLIAGLLTLFHPYFFNTVLYPINDLAFTAIFFVLAWLVWNVECGKRNAEVRTTDYKLNHEDTKVTKVSEVIANPSSGDSAFRFPFSAFGMGALAGLLIWSKPSGASLLGGLALWSVVVWWREYRRKKNEVPVRSLALLAAGFAVVLLPLVARNLFALGSIYFSTESLDAWILRFWPAINWENIYKVYVGAPDYPHPRWVIGGKFGYQNLVDAVAVNFRYVWEHGVLGGLKNSDFIVGPLQLAGALVGFFVLSRRVADLFAMVAFSLVVYALFVLLYWHFEGRYFQVAIPWLYILLAYAIVQVWDKVRALLPLQGAGWLNWVVPLLALAALLVPYMGEMKDYLTQDTRPTSFTVAMGWLSRNSTPGDVIMTRDPWELNWYTRRRAVMIPFDDLATIKQVAKEYGVTMLQIGGPGDSPLRFQDCPADANAAAQYPTGSRPALGKLYCGFELPGFSRVYQNNDLIIYRLTPPP